MVQLLARALLAAQMAHVQPPPAEEALWLQGSAWQQAPPQASRLALAVLAR